MPYRIKQHPYFLLSAHTDLSVPVPRPPNKMSCEEGDNMVEQLLKKHGLTYRQRLFSLAREAENSIAPIQLTERAQWFFTNGIISDMGEGKAPYRPRYVVPDYDTFLKQGSKFLLIDPPSNLFEAVSALLILYHHVPSVTGLPVYIGHLDRLLEPYIEDEQEAEKLIQMLLTQVDRTISDSFCHCDIGPYFDQAAAKTVSQYLFDLQSEYAR